MREICGSVYGVALNDRLQFEALKHRFLEEPYGSPPRSPVVYLKPRTCVTMNGAPIVLSGDLTEVEAAATIALLFGDQPNVPAAAAIALDVSEPYSSFYRPPVRQRGRDTFLPVARAVDYSPQELLNSELVTSVDDEVVHRWSLERLLRPIDQLIAELASFMTFHSGDALLIGLPGDAPRVSHHAKVSVTHPHLPSLDTRCVGEAAAA